MMPHGEPPDITAGTDGQATKAVKCDKLKLAEVQGRSVMVHRYGTNETPESRRAAGRVMPVASSRIGTSGAALRAAAERSI